MIASLANKLLRRIGLQLTRVSRQRSKSVVRWRGRRPYLDKISADPLNPDLHLSYAKEALNRGLPFLAYAELKSAEFLGASSDRIGERLVQFERALPDLARLNHNRFFRLKSLASEVALRAGERESAVSILDVGGGEGQLAAFMPQVKYCLAEPVANGINGSELPFEDRAFDYVVSCHVLEHVPSSERTAFLDQLLAKSRCGVILLNPFEIEGAFATQRLELIHSVTRSRWAKEHLDCVLPRIQDIRKYASDRDLECSVKPNGTMTSSMAFVFADYFAAKSGMIRELEAVNKFVNESYLPILDHDEFPNAYLVYLGRL